MPTDLNITKEKIDYFVRIADLIVIIVDYFTIEQDKLKEFAAYAVGSCIQRNKGIEIIIKIEDKINIDKLQKLLGQSSQFKKLCKGLIIEVGKFNYTDEEEEE